MIDNPEGPLPVWPGAMHGGLTYEGAGGQP
jgi:hypothetical protein